MVPDFLWHMLLATRGSFFLWMYHLYMFSYFGLCLFLYQSCQPFIALLLPLNYTFVNLLYKYNLFNFSASEDHWLYLDYLFYDCM